MVPVVPVVVAPVVLGRNVVGRWLWHGHQKVEIRALIGLGDMIGI